MVIKELREKAGVSQQELSEKLSVDRSAVAKWETGKANPTADKLPEIAKALNCKIEDLFGNERKG